MKTKKQLFIFNYIKKGVFVLFLFFTSISSYAGGSTGDMIKERWGHTSTFLYSIGATEGVVLSIGGFTETGEITKETEAYVVSSKTYVPIGPMNKPRAMHRSVLLKNGKLLIIGGRVNGATRELTSSCEIFDPATASFTYTDSMSYKREMFIAILLSSGEVLVAGGNMKGSGLGNEAEIFDPVTSKWRKVASMNLPRIGHEGISLSSNPDLKKDKILVTGGYVSVMSSTSYTNNTSEIYDYATNSWKATRPMNYPHSFHIISRLDNTHYGEPVILIAGGYADTTATGNIVVLKEAEIFIPSLDVWAKTVSMNTPRVYFTANLITFGGGTCGGGDVIVAGGFKDLRTLTAAKDIEMFHFIGALPIWVKGPDMITARGSHTAVFIPVGITSILVNGGAGTGYVTTLKKSELIP